MRLSKFIDTLGTDVDRAHTFGVRSPVPDISKNVSHAVGLLIFDTGGAKNIDDLPVLDGDVRAAYKTYLRYKDRNGKKGRSVVRRWLNALAVNARLGAGMDSRELLKIAATSSPLVQDGSYTAGELMKLDDAERIPALYKGMLAILEQEQLDRWSKTLTLPDDWETLAEPERQSSLAVAIDAYETTITTVLQKKLAVARRAKNKGLTVHEDIDRLTRLVADIQNRIASVRGTSAPIATIDNRQAAQAKILQSAYLATWALLLETAEGDETVQKRAALSRKLRKALARIRSRRKKGSGPGAAADDVEEIIAIDPETDDVEEITATGSNADDDVEEIIATDPTDDVEEIVATDPADDVEEIVASDPADDVEEIIATDPADDVEEIIAADPDDDVEEIIDAFPPDDLEQILDDFDDLDSIPDPVVATASVRGPVILPFPKRKEAAVDDPSLARKLAMMGGVYGGMIKRLALPEKYNEVMGTSVNAPSANAPAHSDGTHAGAKDGKADAAAKKDEKTKDNKAGGDKKAAEDSEKDEKEGEKAKEDKMHKHAA
ncbi:hypothetical protein HZA87_00560 [Candidatus Uhrbacteria bacterium]|nr:hypothetical protein [Candidatus Uhrbacteria bacterium]